MIGWRRANRHRMCFVARLLAVATVSITALHGNVQGFSFQYTQKCYLPGGLGVCVAAEECSEFDPGRAARCPGKVCCDRRKILPPGTVVGQVTVKGQLQLVRDCGRTQPTSLFLTTGAGCQRLRDGGPDLEAAEGSDSQVVDLTFLDQAGIPDYGGSVGSEGLATSRGSNERSPWDFLNIEFIPDDTTSSDSETPRAGNTATDGDFLLGGDRRGGGEDRRSGGADHVSGGNAAANPFLSGEGAFVAGGYNAVVGKWPWIVLLGEPADRDGHGAGDGIDAEPRWLCGGSLLSARTVLTAAHCVSGRAAAHLVVRLGEYDVSTGQDDDSQHGDATVDRIIMHPAYRASHNDVALLLLSSRVAFDERVQPICLPPPHAEHVGRTADLAGWGRLKFAGNVSDVLQEVAVQVVDPDECELVFAPLHSFRMQFPGGFRGDTLCANGANGTSRDACQGDSGGPLVVNGTDGRYQLIGVVSTGLGCGNPKYPGIYTKVSKYIQWIIENAE